MTIKTINWAIETDAKTPVNKILLIILANHANDNFICWPSIQTLMKECCCHKQTIYNALKNLVELGLVTIRRRKKRGSEYSRSNIYILNPIPDHVYTIDEILSMMNHDDLQKEDLKWILEEDDSLFNRQSDSLPDRQSDESLDSPPDRPCWSTSETMLVQQLDYVGLPDRPEPKYNPNITNIEPKEYISNFDLKTKALELSSKETRNRDFKNQAVEILNFLNTKTGRHFRAGEVNLKFIVARLKSGATPMQCRQVIAKKCREWLTNPAMSEYLRPATLFNATKFEQYLGELGALDLNQTGEIYDQLP